MILKISRWLKQSIPGIVFLGALGSLLAALSVNAVTQWIPSAYRGIWASVFDWKYTHLYSLGVLEGAENLSGMVTYISFHLATSLSGLILFCTFLLLVFRESSHKADFTFGQFLMLVFSFFCLYLAMINYWHLSDAYQLIMGPIFERANEALMDR